MLNGYVVSAVGVFAGFGAPDDLCGNAEGFAVCDDAPGCIGIAVDLHAVPHVVDAEHLLVARAAGRLNGLEDRGDGEEVVLDVVHPSAEANALGLAATRAVDHAMDAFAGFGEKFLDNGRVGASRTQQGLAHRHVRVGEQVVHLVRAAIEVLLIGREVDGFRVFLQVVGAEQVMPGTGQAIAADAGVCKSLVIGLAGGGETDDGEAGLDVGVIDDIGAIHDDDGAGIDGDGACQVADIGRFAPAAVDADPVFTECSEEVFGARNQLAECFARDSAGVPINRAGNEDAIDCADAEQVVNIHDEAVLRRFAEGAGIASLTVVQVGESALRAGAVGVDNVTLGVVARQDVRTDFAKGTGEDATVEVVDDGVDFGLGGGDASLGVAIL